MNLSSKLRSRFGKNLFFSFVTFLRFGFCVRASEAAGGGFQFFPVLHRLESLTGSRTDFLFGWSMSLTCAYVRGRECDGSAGCCLKSGIPPQIFVDIDFLRSKPFSLFRWTIYRLRWF